MGDLDIYNSLPISYNKDSNELIINLPKDIKIKFTNSVDIITDGEFNLMSFGEMNLLSIFNNIHLETLDATIHLNSRRAKQLYDLNRYEIPIDVQYHRSLDDLNLSRQRKLEMMELCLHKMFKQ